MTALFIGPEEQDLINDVIAKARAHVIPWEVVKAGAVADETTRLTLADRKPGFERPPSDHIILPMGYRCALSFEEQPAGIMRHLSVSVERAGRMVPSPRAIAMICEAFGFSSFPPDAGRVWLEEFDPGQWAVNVIEIEHERTEGHA